MEPVARRNVLLTVRLSGGMSDPVTVQLVRGRGSGRADACFIRWSFERGATGWADTSFAVGDAASETEVPTEEAEAILSNIRSAKLPPSFGGGMGLDGKSVEVIFGNEWGGTIYRWWMRAPREWEELEEAVQWMRRHLPFYT